MDRAEAGAVYDAGREACVEFLVELTSGYEAQIARLEERIRRLEEQARRDSRTSSKPPSSDPPKTRQQRRAEARAKAKELLGKEGERRKVGGQPGHRGAGRELKPETRSMRSSITIPRRAVAVAASSQRMSGTPGRGSVAIRWRSCRRSA